MSGLVDEIQQDALDASVSIAMLLRKVRLAAAKLNLPSIEAWVELELNGYPAKVPPYRVLRGRPRAHNPFNGWIPIHASAEWMDVISQVKTGQSVTELEHILSRDGTIHIPIDPELVDIINQNMRVPFAEMSVFLERADVTGILERVRTMVLDWAIALHKAGIQGEGMSFKKEEKVAAQNNPAITIGSVGTLVGVVGNNNHVRDIVGKSVNVTEIRDLAQQLNDNHTNLVKAGADDQALSKAVKGIIFETDKSEPDSAVLAGLLSDARSALTGAAGNLMASGALTLIASLIGS